MIKFLRKQTISSQQSKWLQKCFHFTTQRKNQAINDFENDFYDLLNIAFYEKTMQSMKRLKRIFLKKDNDKEIIKQQSKLKFNEPINLLEIMIFKNQNDISFAEPNLLKIRGIEIE